MIARVKRPVGPTPCARVPPPVIAVGAAVLLSLSSHCDDVALARALDGAPIVQNEDRCSLSAFDKVGWDSGFVVLSLASPMYGIG